ncbi:MAG: DRTGG domain-containing protein [Deltaproteobacteria bacterium]|nr:DRTGG domain-containing protein [Deltaproteobacteria bacterium]
MNIETIVQALHLEVRSGEEQLQGEVRGGYVGDLLSDVIANSRERELWITRQVHPNIVAVASLKDLAGIILVRGAEPAADTVEKATQEKIPLLLSDLSAFAAAGRIYQLLSADGKTPL